MPLFSRFTQSFSRFMRDINGEIKHLSLLMIFFTVSFSRFAPSRLTSLFLRKGCFPEDFQEGKRPIKAFGKRPIKVGKRSIKERKRPINANGQSSGTLPWWKTAPLEGPLRGL